MKLPVFSIQLLAVFALTGEKRSHVTSMERVRVCPCDALIGRFQLVSQYMALRESSLFRNRKGVSSFSQFPFRAMNELLHAHGDNLLIGT